MQSFKTFFEQQDFVNFVLNEFDAPTKSESKPWSAKKDEILQTWSNLRPNVPIFMTPMDTTDGTGEHKSYGEDGVRVSGSWQFISSVIGKLKELLQYENDQTKLRLVFRGVEGGEPNRQSFVFYVNSERRQKNRPKRI